MKKHKRMALGSRVRSIKHSQVLWVLNDPHVQKLFPDCQITANFGSQESRPHNYTRVPSLGPRIQTTYTIDHWQHEKLL
jgi:hypothetical protein